MKKIYPPGTFIPTPARIIAIIQLCIAFTALIWDGGEPFMGRLYQVKSQVLLYDHVLSQKETYLNDAEIQSILASYGKVKQAAEIGFWDKLSESVRILFFELHPYEKAWIFFSILIPILLLKKVEGAQYAIWILPLLVGVYGIDNTLHGKQALLSRDVAMFPSESYLLKNYVKEPFSQDILKQHEQLQEAWNLYLIKEWAKEVPSDGNFQEQLKKGTFFFTLERVKNLPAIEPKWRQKEPLGVLAFYFLWHLYAAGMCYNSIYKTKYIRIPAK